MMIYPPPFGLFQPLSDLRLSAVMAFETEALQAGERCSRPQREPAVSCCKRSAEAALLRGLELEDDSVVETH